MSQQVLTHVGKCYLSRVGIFILDYHFKNKAVRLGPYVIPFRVMTQNTRHKGLRWKSISLIIYT